jgi:pimeloyl-ACP methyl ester carboxylesterase
LGIYFYFSREGKLTVRKPLIQWLRGPKYVNEYPSNNTSQDLLIKDDKMPNSCGYIQGPFSVIYGARHNDWFFDDKGAIALCNQLKAEGTPSALFYEMTKAGHVCFLDDTKEFCELIFKCVDDAVPATECVHDKSRV